MRYGETIWPCDGPGSTNVTSAIALGEKKFGPTYAGCAVRFVEQSPPPVKPSSVPAAQNRTIQDRLEELKKICEQELITEADCEAKRKSLVDSL